MMRFHKTILALIVALGLAQTPAVAENFFHWDCESLNSASESFVDMGGPRTSLSSDLPLQGNKSLKFIAVGNDSGNQQEGVEFSSWSVGNLFSGKNIYHRWLMRIDSNFSFGTGTAKWKSSRTKDSDEKLSPAWTGYIAKDSIYIGECWGCSPGGEDPSAAKINHSFVGEVGSGNHEWIVRTKLQSKVGVCDGEFQVFRDGKSLGKVGGRCFATSEWKDKVADEAWNAWMVYPYFQLNGTASNGGAIYVDAISVDSDWNSLSFPEPGSPTPPTTTTTTSSTTTTTLPPPIDPPPVDPPPCEDVEVYQEAIRDCTRQCWWRGCARKCFKQKGVWETDDE